MKATAPKAHVLRRLLALMEPWYDWGLVSVERMEGCYLGDDGYRQSRGERFVRYFDLQWFGIHVGVQFGRTPKVGES